MARVNWVSCALAAMCLASSAFGQSSLTLFHNNDGESKLLGSAGFGGFDHFLGELDNARNAASTAGRDVLTISSGDNILAGLAFDASQDRVGSQPAGSTGNSQNYYDALALSAAQYDAITIGNHEFDFGPAVLDDFIAGYKNAGGTAPFLSANLDFSGEPNLQPRVTNGDIAASTVVTGGNSGVDYGVIGVTTPQLPTISSPGNVTPTDGSTDADAVGDSLQDVADAINSEVANLQSSGVNNIIVSGHLQSINRDQNLVPLLSGVDVIIAGGGDELLKNNPDALTTNPFQPGISGPYPLVSATTDQDGRSVPLVTTAGEYRYVGQLDVEFDANGNVIEAGGLTFDPSTGNVTGTRDGDPILVDPSNSPQATGTFNGIDIQNDIMNPLAADVQTLENTVIGATEVPLNHLRDGGIRTQETNIGNLIADAFVWQAGQIGGLTTDPTIGVTNGGGIRGDKITAGGATAGSPVDLTAGDAKNILPFANSVVVLNGLTAHDLLSALENAVSQVDNVDGRFLQISGFEFTYDVTNAPGDRILDIALADGTPIFTDEDGVLFNGTLDLVTNSFTAGGGDSFDEFVGLNSFDTGVNYGDALVNFIENQLGGTITAADAPVGGDGRITAVPEPTTLALFGLGGLALLRRRR